MPSDKKGNTTPLDENPKRPSDPKDVHNRQAIPPHLPNPLNRRTRATMPHKGHPRTLHAQSAPCPIPNHHGPTVHERHTYATNANTRQNRKGPKTNISQTETNIRLCENGRRHQHYGPNGHHGPPTGQTNNSEIHPSQNRIRPLGSPNES